jgi:hypothetical protein
VAPTCPSVRIRCGQLLIIGSFEPTLTSPNRAEPIAT